MTFETLLIRHCRSCLDNCPENIRPDIAGCMTYKGNFQWFNKNHELIKVTETEEDMNPQEFWRKTREEVDKHE